MRGQALAHSGHVLLSVLCTLVRYLWGSSVLHTLWVDLSQCDITRFGTACNVFKSEAVQIMMRSGQWYGCQFANKSGLWRQRQSLTRIM